MSFEPILYILAFLVAWLLLSGLLSKWAPQTLISGYMDRGKAKTILPEVFSNFDNNIKDKFCHIPERLDGMDVVKGKILLIDSHLHSDMFNILCATSETDRETLVQSIELFKKRHLPFAFWTGFYGEPEWVEKELIRQGLKRSEEELAMQADLSKVPWDEYTPSIEIRPVSNFKELTDLITVMMEIFPGEEHRAISAFFTKAEPIITQADSHLRFFVGYHDNKPVSTSSLFFSRGLASIFDVIVSPSMRGKGLGKQITLHAMKEAKKAGYSHTILTATDDAKYLYEKIGYKKLKMMSVFTP